MAFNHFILRSPPGGLTTAAAISLLQVATSATRGVEILRASLTQRGSVTSVQEKIALVRKSAAATVTAAAIGTTLNKGNPNDQSPSLQLGVALTGTTATVEGTNTDITLEEGFNVLAGWLYLPVPEERISIPAASFLAMTFLAAPASQVWYPEIVMRETT